MANNHPFIVENGAAIYIPEDYFSNNDARLVQGRGKYAGYRYISFCEPRPYWQKLLEAQLAEFGNCFQSFDQLGVSGIAEATGLAAEQAALSNQRGFGEPILWRGSEVEKKRFTAQLTNLGATVLQGGRFLHITGDCDKGRAMQWLAHCYQTQLDTPVVTLAIGDSGNDIAMLEIADHALIIPSPAHPPPRLQRKKGLSQSVSYAPLGWIEGVSALISTD